MEKLELQVVSISRRSDKQAPTLSAPPVDAGVLPLIEDRPNSQAVFVNVISSSLNPLYVLANFPFKATEPLQENSMKQETQCENVDSLLLSQSAMVFSDASACLTLVV